MLGRDHALSGSLAFAALAPVLRPSPVGLAAGVALTGGAALLPDFDEPGSTIARTAGFLTVSFAWLVRTVSRGHRKGSHCLFGITAFAAAGWAAVRFDGGRAGQVALWLFLSLLLAAAVRAVRLHRHHGDALGVTAAAAMVWWHAGLTLAPLCIGLGAFVHVIGDMATDSGVPLLFPLVKHDFHVLPLPLCFKTGKWVEHRLVSPLLLAGLGWLLWRDAGMLAHIRPQ